MSRVRSYISLVKFSHTIFAMPFAIIGFSLAVQELKKDKFVFTFRDLAWKFILVLMCMVFARNTAMAFNRYLDRRFDALNPRTSIREIPMGIISGRSVLVFTIVNAFLFIVTSWFINGVCFALSPIALFVILFYSYTKQFTSLCHLVLGLGLSLAPIGAYLALTGYFSLLPLLFSFAVLFWVAGFDIIYALQDEDFDKANNLYSIPSFLGKRKALNLSVLVHVLSAFFIFCAGYFGGFGYLYWLGVVVFVGMLIYQHSIVKPADLSRVNLAFMTANGVASVVFAIFVLLDLFLRK
jgi:4-hydroxybenzoate polyprenyltransferase